MEGDYTKKRFIKEMRQFCSQHGYDSLAVGKEVSRLFFSHRADIDLYLDDKMLDLMTMEDGPEFEMTEEEFNKFLDEM